MLTCFYISTLGVDFACKTEKHKVNGINFYLVVRIFFSCVLVFLLLVLNSFHFIDADVRLARRIRRDTVERGRDINSVLEQVRCTLLNMYNHKRRFSMMHVIPKLM